MPDIDFSAMQKSFEARQAKAAQPIADASNHNEAQSLLDHAQTIARGGMDALEEFGKGLYESSPIGATQAGQENRTPQSMFGSAIPKMSPEQNLQRVVDTGPAGRKARQIAGARGMVSGVESAAEFWGFGKVAGMAGKALENAPLVAKISPVISGIIKTASKSVGLTMGDEEASLLGRRVLASTVVGGALTGAAGQVQSTVSGQPTRLGPNIALGMLFGAAGGLLPGDHARMDAKTVDAVHNSMLSFGEKADVQKFSKVATAWGKTNGYSAGESMRRFSRVMLGFGSDVDRISISQMAAAKPEIFEGKLLAGLSTAADTGKPQFNVPEPHEIDGLMSKLPGRAADTEMFAQPMESFSAQSNPVLLPGEAAKGEYGSSGLFVGKPTLAGTPVEARIYRSELPSGARIATKESRAAYEAAIPGEKPQIAPEKVQYTLPVGGDPAVDIPAAPKLTPPNLTKVQSEIFEHASGADWEKLDTRIAKNQNSLVAFGKMVVHGILEPKHITNADVAATASSYLREIASDIDPKTNAAQFDMMEEHAAAFAERAAELRGSRVNPDNRFVREPESGDIVRTVDVGNDKVALIDKRGKVAVMARDAAPSHVLKASLDDVLHSEGKSSLEEAFGPVLKSDAFEKFITGSGSGRFQAGAAEEAAADAFARRRTAELEGREKTAGKTTAKDIAAIKETEEFGKQQRQAAKERGTKKVKVAKVNKANDLKALEAALTKGKPESIEPPPTPGTHPIAAVIREKIKKLDSEQKAYSTYYNLRTYPAGKVSAESLNVMASSPEEALAKAKEHITTNLKEKGDFLGFDKQSPVTEFNEKAAAERNRRFKKGITGFEKGAITIGRGKRVTDSSSALLAARLNAEVWQTKEGIVTKLESGEERIWPSDDHAYEYLKKYTTGARIMAEHAQIADESVAHLDPVSPTKIARAGAKATRLPITNLRKAAMLAKEAAKLEGAESPPLMARLHHIADPGTALVNRVKRQHAVLMQMGEGGQQLANLAKQRSATQDMLGNYISRRVVEPLKLLKKIGVTVTQIEDGTAPKEALDLYDKTFGAAAKEVYDTMNALGGDTAPLIEGKRYAHHWFNFKGADVPADILDEARQLGVATDADGLAKTLNDPEGSIPKPASKNDLSTYASKILWARQKATSVAHALETERRGNVGFSDDLEVMAHKYVDSVSNRLADVATFGPKDEAINSNLAKIADSHPGHSLYVAAGIMNDVRGKVYIPMSPITRMAGSGLRLWLGAAGPKHIFQNALTWAYFGTPRFVEGTLSTALHGVFFGETAEAARDAGATIGWTGQQLGEYPDQFLKEGSPDNIARMEEWGNKMGLPKISRYLGNAGTASLHVFLNAGRINAFRVATQAFPKYLQKAMAGDAEALSLISEVYKAKVTPEFLRARDPDAMKARFGKMFADVEGMTYKPEDYPAMSRTQEGRELTRFKVFRWNLFHNLFQGLNDPNIPFATRAKRVARLFMAVPALGALDPIIRHKMGIGTIDSETAYDAWTRWTKDKGNLGKAAYMITMLAAHGGAFGLADDLIQGFNLRNPAIMERATTLNPAIVAPAMSAAEASSRAAHAVLKGNRKEFRKAGTDLATILSPSIGAGIARAKGARKPVRLPKQMVIREMMHAGP